MTFDEWWRNCGSLWGGDAYGLAEKAWLFAEAQRAAQPDSARLIRWNPNTSRYEPYSHLDDLSGQSSPQEGG